MANWRHLATYIWVNIGSGNGFLPDGIKPLPGLMLSSHWWGSMAYTLEWFRSERCSHISMRLVWKVYFEFSATSPMGQLVNSSPHSDAYMRQWILSCQAIIEANAGLLSIGTSGTNRSEILFTKMHLKIPTAKWGPFCSEASELTQWASISSIYPTNAVGCIRVAVHVSGPCSVKHP